MQKIQLKLELEQVMTPLGFGLMAFKDRAKNIAELLTATARIRGDQEAIISMESRLSYNQLVDFIDSLSSNLNHKYGIKKGDRVAIMLQNGWEYAVSFFALMKLGAIAVPLNTAYKGEEFAFQVNDSGSKMVITNSKFMNVVDESKSNIKRSINVLLTDTENFQSMLKKSLPEKINIQVDETDSAVIMYTSGTTGRPKGAVLVHRNLIANAMCMSEAMGWQAGKDKHLCPVPLFHVTGLVMNLCASVYSGTPLLLMEKFKAADALDIIEKERITTAIGVPTIMWLMINAPEFDRDKVRSLRCFAAGGSSSPKELLKAFKEKMPGAEFCPGYGLSETTGMVTTTLSIDEALSHSGSVGRALPVIEVKVVDPSGRTLHAGEAGELMFRGCHVFKEYWNNPDATKKTLVKGWLRTGDVGKIDEGGYVYIYDRIKDMINRGGEKIWSLEIENVLYQNPKILEAAAIAVPDQVFGEEVKAVIVLKKNESATSDEIREFCGQHLARYKVPRYVEFLGNLPRNAAGKVLKRRLK